MDPLIKSRLATPSHIHIKSTRRRTRRVRARRRRIVESELAFSCGPSKRGWCRNFVFRHPGRARCAEEPSTASGTDSCTATKSIVISITSSAIESSPGHPLVCGEMIMLQRFGCGTPQPAADRTPRLCSALAWSWLAARRNHFTASAYSCGTPRHVVRPVGGTHVAVECISVISYKLYKRCTLRAIADATLSGRHS